MKKKHLLFFLFAGILTTGGCSSGGGEDIPEPHPKPEQPSTPQPPAPAITVSSEIIANGLSFSNEAGSQTQTSSPKKESGHENENHSTTRLSPIKTSSN